MSFLEGFATLFAELAGLDGWFRRKGELRRGCLLRARAQIVLSADAGEKGHFLATLPKGAIVRVDRMASGDAPVCWARPVNERVRQAIVPRALRRNISSRGYELVIPFDDLREHFDVTRKADPSQSS